MCDTFLALSTVTLGGNVLLAKNSDREPTEAQEILVVPRRQPQERRVRCTFINIPQEAETQGCILSKPFHMWGAEMGVNESGVAIGNEAVFTKVAHPRRNDGLTGMDLLRLALERSTSASQAVQCITTLLETYGQDACGGYRDRRFFYHNSFLIADATEAWALETAGREWATQRVDDIRSISNRLSIASGGQYSNGAQSTAMTKRWWDGQSAFDFQHAYSDRLYSWLGRAASRASCTAEACSSHRGNLTAAHCMQILQTHNLPDDRFHPGKANTGSICMHRTSILNPSETTGSMVAELRRGSPHTIWLTGTPHPCLSVYVPFFFGVHGALPILHPSDSPDGSLWWKAHTLHHQISRDYQRNKPRMDQERRELQQTFVREEASWLAKNPSPDQLAMFTQDCLTRTEQALDRWIARF